MRNSRAATQHTGRIAECFQCGVRNADCGIFHIPQHFPTFPVCCVAARLGELAALQRNARRSEFHIGLGRPYVTRIFGKTVKTGRGNLFCVV